MQDYWAEKKERSKMAVSHTKEMQDRYGPQISACVSETVIYGPDELNGVLSRDKAGLPNIVLKNIDSVRAVMMTAERYGKTAVLNFSCYKHPGGMFIQGSKAQEECLCMESFLYNVLKEKESDFYIPNRKDPNRSLYRNKALYTPDVLFMRGSEVKKCDVITCAAPNATASRKYNGTSEDVIDRTLRDRIFFVCAAAEKENVRTLILGAYGCGVFGNDPLKTGQYFCEALCRTHVRNVLFAVPGRRNDPNYVGIEKAVRNFVSGH